VRPTTMKQAVSRRVALVTGPNRGIGHEVCRQLAKQKLRVILTARHAEAAESAAAELQAEASMWFSR